MKHILLLVLTITLLVPLIFAFLFSIGFGMGWLFVLVTGIETLWGIYIPYLTGFIFAFLSMAIGRSSD